MVQVTASTHVSLFHIVSTCLLPAIRVETEAASIPNRKPKKLTMAALPVEGELQEDILEAIGGAKFPTPVAILNPTVVEATSPDPTPLYC